MKVSYQSALAGNRLRVWGSGTLGDSQRRLTEEGDFKEGS